MIICSFVLLSKNISSSVFSGCKGTKFRNIHQISCIIQKISLILQPRKKIFPFRAPESPSNRIIF